VGIVFLAMLLAGLVASARRALARDLTASLGPVAVLATWALHAGIDWDWEMPAVTLPALACAGLVIALADGDAQPRRSALKRRSAAFATRGS
jgi:peptidoglycan/LPS O-acetylase OafA/YrhL